MHYDIVNGDSGIVNADSDVFTKIVHHRAESPFTFNQNPCSRCFRIAVHDQSEYARKLTAIRVDVSERTPELYKMMEKYHVVGVPTMIFYNSHGEQLTETQLNDKMTKENLYLALAKLS